MSYRCLLLLAALTALVPLRAEAEDKLQPIQPEDPQLGRAVDFERDVYPILDANCVACHNVAIAESKLILEDVESILKGGKRGPGVVAEKPDDSLIYQVAAHTKEPAMPPLPNNVEATTLTPRQLGILRQWIQEGAKEGSGSAGMAINWQKVPSGIQSSYSAALSDTGRYAAVTRANRISIYDLATHREVDQLHDPLLTEIKTEDGKPLYGPQAAHQDFVHAVAFDPSANLLASGGYRVIKLWERPTNVRLWQQPAAADVTAVALDAQRQHAAYGTADHKIILVNLADGQTVRELAGHQGPVTGLAFSADGATLFSGSADKKLVAWKVADGQPQGEIVTPAEVLCVTLNKDGNRIVSGHADNQLRVWDLPGVAKPAEGETDIKPLAELKGHGQPVSRVLPHPADGNQVVSSSQDGTVRFWKLDNGQNLRTINHGAAVNDVALSDDGKWVASAGADGVARIWQADNGQKKVEVKGQAALQQQQVVLDEKLAVAKQRVALADARVKAEEKAVTERTEALTKAKEALEAADKALKEAQDKYKAAEEAVAAAKKEFEGKPEDKELEKKVKDAETALGKEQENLKKAEEAQKVAANSVKLSDQALQNSQQSLATAKTSHETEQKLQTDAEAAQTAGTQTVTEAAKPLVSVAFSPGGATFAVGSEDGTWSLWETTVGTPLETFSGLQGAARNLQFVDDTRVVSASADKQLSLWNTQPGWKLVARLGPSAEEPLNLTDSICEDRVVSLAFSHDGTKLVSGGGEPSRNGELILWSVPERTVVRNFFDAHSDTVLGVEFSYDDQFILSGAADKFAKLFSVASGEFVRAFEGHTHHVMDVALKADGSELATAGADNAIKIWNLETGEQKRTITSYSKQVTSIQYIGTEDQIASCGGDASVRLHRTANGQNFRNFSGAKDYLYAVAITRDSLILIAAGEDGVLRVWNGTNGQSTDNFEPPQPAAAGQQASAQ